MIKTTLLSAIFLTSLFNAQAKAPKQFPDDNLVYVPRVHTGFTQYRARVYGEQKSCSHI